TEVPETQRCRQASVDLDLGVAAGAGRGRPPPWRCRWQGSGTFEVPASFGKRQGNTSRRSRLPRGPRQRRLRSSRLPSWFSFEQLRAQTHLERVLGQSVLTGIQVAQQPR